MGSKALGSFIGETFIRTSSERLGGAGKESTLHGKV
jgi:hypothetical protein